MNMENHKDHKSKGQPNENHHMMMVQDFRRRFVVTGALSVPILALSPTVQGWLGYSLPDIPALKWLLFALATAVVVWGGKPFYVNALKELKRRRLGMMVLVSLAVGAGYLYSASTTFLIDAPDFYWEISTLTVFLLFGHWMEMRSVVGAGGALRELVKLIPPKANLLEAGETREVETEELSVGDLILIRPGEKVPIDGVVREGSSHLNEAMLTGESKPVRKAEGDEVVGGTLNTDGSLKIEVTKVGEETALAQIVAMVQDAQESKPRTQKLADLAAHYLTITAVSVGVGTILVWFFVLDATFVRAMTLSITVIVITCPHALGLAIPMVTMVTTSLAAKNGILIRDMTGLEGVRKAKWILFDKTGTLTQGNFGVTDVIALGDADERGVLAAAASLDRNSEHVIAKSIVSAAKKDSLEISGVQDFQNVAGKGVTGKVEGHVTALGNLALMEHLGIDVGAVDKAVEDLSGNGRTLVYLVQDEKLIGLIALADEVREQSHEAMEELRAMGFKLAMVTGDNDGVASAVASELGLDAYYSEVLPEDKVAKVKELQKGGEAVVMVGDGVNDAPALAQADVGVAIGAGTDVAVASSEVVLVKSNPLDIVKLIKLSRATRGKMVQNLAWATGYNVIAIPLAAGVLVPWGVVLRPEWGALIMSASSIIVVTNALLLRRQSFS